MISCTTLTSSFFLSLPYSRHAKSVWSPSSLEINSLEKVNPGINPRFFSQNREQKEPEKKIPSTAANATNLWANEAFLHIHLIAHSALLAIAGMLCIAVNNEFF